MPINTFRTFNDGLLAEQRTHTEYTTDTNLDDDRLWIPYVEGAWFQACSFNVSTGGFTNVLKIAPGAMLNPHYHISTVYGYTLRGSWHYLEHDWVATPGTFIYEPPGEAHTLVVPADAKEPMITFFHVSGGLIYLDTVDNGKIVAYDDGFTLLELARKHYQNVGLDQSLLDRLIR
ncbi:2,4'-dihydroxyacetophenone dioxygenase family protein [Arsenicibacter rosenii]|uniref:2,4'-dihydroxyacetophenone dioxygenase family protein n=1 Tax=Arsenicibacter rosenii TaxID=1750698 RepID=UPI0009F726E3|nr:2,4'-dihydroxyacetophenone dioxygenase family protein [Arsenicibacter rosenii]